MTCAGLADALASGGPIPFDAKVEVSRLLQRDSVKVVVAHDQWAIGKSKVFLKAGVLAKIEALDVCVRCPCDGGHG